MRTKYETGLGHPEDLLRRFAGRISVLHALGVATLDLHQANREQDVTSYDPACSEDLARLFVELCEDYDDMRKAIEEWLADQRAVTR